MKTKRHDSIRVILASMLTLASTLALVSCGDGDAPDDSRVLYRDGDGMNPKDEGARSLVRFAMEKDDGKESFYCSGVLIHPKVVLTAGHCVVAVNDETQKLGAKYDPKKIKIRLSNGAETRAADTAYPENLRFAFNHVDGMDIGYVVLEKPAPAGLEATVASPAEFKGWTNQFGARGKGIGYGMTTNGSMSAGFLNTLELPYVGPFGPRKDAGTLEIRPADSSDDEARVVEFMAGFDSVNACNGDSGGGFFIGVGGKLKLAGITSRGISAPTFDGESCAIGTLTTIFGAADVAAEWVEARLPDVFADPSR